MATFLPWARSPQAVVFTRRGCRHRPVLLRHARPYPGAGRRRSARRSLRDADESRRRLAYRTRRAHQALRADRGAPQPGHEASSAKPGRPRPPSAPSPARRDDRAGRRRRILRWPLVPLRATAAPRRPRLARRRHRSGRHEPAQARERADRPRARRDTARLLLGEPGTRGVDGVRQARPRRQAPPGEHAHGHRRAWVVRYEHERRLCRLVCFSRADGGRRGSGEDAALRRHRAVRRPSASHGDHASTGGRQAA